MPFHPFRGDPKYPRRCLAATLVAWGVLATGSSACAVLDLVNPDYGEPPNASKYDPGSGSAGDKYGYGTNTGPSKPACPADLRRCTHTITYPDGGENSVELRGDFGGPGTWEAGKPMTKSGGVWTVEIEVPYDKPIQYKFVINGTDWKTDPAQPTSTDAGGNTKNTFAGTKCASPTCEEEGELPPGVYDWRDSVIYFTFVDRFNNGDTSLDEACRVHGVSGPIADYEGGDWAGITQKINQGYFGQLGVNTLWITVPFDNPEITGIGVGGDSHMYSGYHGYWPKLDSSDPTRLNHESCFGSFQDLKALVSAAHKKGIKVLFDYAMVHVHKSSAIFNQHNDWFWPNSKNG